MGGRSAANAAGGKTEEGTPGGPGCIGGKPDITGGGGIPGGRAFGAKPSGGTIGGGGNGNRPAANGGGKRPPAAAAAAANAAAGGGGIATAGGLVANFPALNAAAVKWKESKVLAKGRQCD